MEKEFQAGYSFLERTGIAEKLYCECYVPVSIYKWYEQIKVSSEMEALLLQLYRKIGRLEGIIALMDSCELECINNLIDRRNIGCYYKNKKQAIELTDCFDRMHDNEFVQAEIKAIDFFSELNHLRRSRRTEFIFHKSIIGFMRQEFNPTAPGRIEDCVADLLSVIAEYKNALKRQKESLDPVLFGGLLCYQLFTISPYEEDNFVYSTYAVCRTMWEMKIFPRLSIPFAKYMYENRNECEDRMAEARQTGNINQWLLFYLDILVRAIEVEYNFIIEQHRCKVKSLETVKKVKGVSVNMRNQMFQEVGFMHQTPVFRIEDVMHDFDITHSTATKMINAFIKKKIVKQINEKQRYRMYEYVPLMESIKKI